MAVDPTGNVFAVAVVPGPNRNPAFCSAVVKLSASQGRQLWKVRLRADQEQYALSVSALRTSADGDVVACGTVDLTKGPYGFFVERLGGNGRVEWQRIVQGHRFGPADYEPEEASALALDSAGSALVAGYLEGSTTALYHSKADLAVVKLDAATGAERWRFTLNGSGDDGDYGTGVAVDAVGDVIAVGRISSLEGYPVTVVKLSGSDGHLLWRRDVVQALEANDVVVDRAGDVLIAALLGEPTGNAFGVVKLLASTGDVLWIARVSGAERQWQTAMQVRTLPSGDVAAVGMTADATEARSLTTVRLDGSTGIERWRSLLGGNTGYGFGRGLAISTTGDPIVAGEVRNRGTCYDVTLSRLSATTGERVSKRTLDGLSTASWSCELPDCGDAHGPCGRPRQGIDQDSFAGLATDATGRVVVSASLSDGPRGQWRAFVASMPPLR